MRRLYAVLAMGALLGVLLASSARAAGLSYSYVDWAGFDAHPQTGADGRGTRFSLSYALSGNAFLYAGAAQYDFASFLGRRYAFGVGINSTVRAGYSLFARVGWNHIGISPDGTAAPALSTAFRTPSTGAGAQDHGFGAAFGMRVLMRANWELYALARVEHNNELARRVSGEFGVLYALSAHMSVGAGVNATARESDYLLMLRAYY
ncbi:MAG: hypothetical protein ACYDB9_08590 [Gammaproteobacteria bacterium]